jgi:AmmeMemoRadiSam system protein B
MTREPAVAGQFYPGSKATLSKLVAELTQKNLQLKSAIGIISPHAGFVYSGPVAGKVFSQLKLPDVFIIMGPNHTGRGRPYSLVKEGVWQTPLGKVEIDIDLAGDLLLRSRFLQDDITAHAFEHSIEVQLPFIQFFKEEFKFVPIILSNAGADVYLDIAESVAKVIKESKKEILIIASSDMTHYEPHKIAKAKDQEAIKAILNLNEKELLKKIDDLDISMCGYAPTVVMIIAAKMLGAKTAELVEYQTSGDVSGDYASVVGYAGIIVS